MNTRKKPSKQRLAKHSKKFTSRATIKAFCGFEYVTLKNVPSIESKEYGIAYDANFLRDNENLLAKEMICNKEIPLRGKEVHFIRKIAGMSLKQLGDFLGVSAVAIKKWEDQKDKRVSVMAEIAIRVVFAEYFQLNLKGTKSELVGNNLHAKKILLEEAA